MPSFKVSFNKNVPKEQTGGRVCGVLCGRTSSDPNDLHRWTKVDGEKPFIRCTESYFGPDDWYLYYVWSSFTKNRIFKTIREEVPENAKITRWSFNIYVTRPQTVNIALIVSEEQSNFVDIKKGWNTFYFSSKNEILDAPVVEIPLQAHYNFMEYSYNKCSATFETQPDFDQTRTMTRTFFSYDAIINKNIWVDDFENTPYIEVEYEYNPPVSPDNLIPNKTVVNPRKPIRFSWNSTVNQQYYQIRYKVNEDDWAYIEKESTKRYYDMPASTIKASDGQVIWEVRVKEDSGIYSNWVEATFDLGTDVQRPPRIVAPDGKIVKSTEELKFEWNFIPNIDEIQKSFKIEVFYDGKTESFYEASELEFYYPKLKFDSSKIVQWRVRVTNQYGDLSDWSSLAMFQVVTTPPAPQIISVENNNRPLIIWSSREQESYRIEIQDMKGNTVYKTQDIISASDREHKVQTVLPNGKYLIKIKVSNAYGLDSPITEYTHIIDPTPIDQPTISLYKSDFFVELSSTSLNGEVLRDGKLIGNLKLGKFRDYAGANYKTYSYQIRVFENDVAGISEKVGGVTEFGEINTLATVDDLANYFKISYGLDEPVTKTIDYSVQGTEVQLEGRKYPFVEFSSHSTAGFSLSFYVETLEQVKELKTLVDQRKEFLLRESRGKNIQGVLYGFNAEYHNLGYKISCTMTITGEDYD